MRPDCYDARCSDVADFPALRLYVTLACPAPSCLPGNMQWQTSTKAGQRFSAAPTQGGRPVYFLERYLVSIYSGGGAMQWPLGGLISLVYS